MVPTSTGDRGGPTAGLKTLEAEINIVPVVGFESDSSIAQSLSQLNHRSCNGHTECKKQPQLRTESEVALHTGANTSTDMPQEDKQ
jgi:hypothetical protein